MNYSSLIFFTAILFCVTGASFMKSGSNGATSPEESSLSITNAVQTKQHKIMETNQNEQQLANILPLLTELQQASTYKLANNLHRPQYLYEQPQFIVYRTDDNNQNELEQIESENLLNPSEQQRTYDAPIMDKRAQTFVRFGKRAQTFVRFGKK